jgi:mono/diheme cytochrome c family protein
MSRLLFCVGAILLTVCIVLIGCGSSPQAVQTGTSQPASGSTTAGQLSDLGQAVYSNSCASCHGSPEKTGKAPVLWGSAASLGKYNTAQGLFNYISTTMPFNSPGSLSRLQYQQVTMYLLVQNQFVQAGTVPDINNLGAISLK